MVRKATLPLGSKVIAGRGTNIYSSLVHMHEMGRMPWMGDLGAKWNNGGNTFLFSYFLGTAVSPCHCSYISLAECKGLGKWVFSCVFENTCSMDRQEHINISNWVYICLKMFFFINVISLLSAV